MDKKTTLYNQHVDLGAKMVPFGGFIMPIQYKTGIIAEHMAVRQNIGIFDISHMGEFLLYGKDALQNLQNIMSNDFSKMEYGDIKYTIMCDKNGGCIDDLLVFYKSENYYILVVNAANLEKDYSWIKENIVGDTVLENHSDDVSAVAIQGPKSLDFMKKICKENIDMKYYTFKDDIDVLGVNCTVSRTGYTGEDGFEIYFSNDNSEKIWTELLSNGEEFGIVPCGLGARDTLRLEAGMPLYGHELNNDITPIEAGLKFFVKMDKPNFIGKEALEKKIIPTRKRIGLVLKERAIARDDAKIMLDNKEVGFVTSGTMCPYLKQSVAMAYVNADILEDNNEFYIDIRGKQIPAEKVKLPFYKRIK